MSALRELIAALDRHVPHVERAGEILIAMDAARLRSEAVARLEELKHAGSDHHYYDQERVEAIMTDDGEPTPDSGGKGVFCLEQTIESTITTFDVHSTSEPFA